MTDSPIETLAKISVFWLALANRLSKWAFMVIVDELVGSWRNP